jgi:hypothetical protein
MRSADFAHGVPPDAEGEGGKMKPAGGETHRGLPRLGSWTSLCMGATSVAGNAVNAIVPKLIPEESPAAVVSRAGLWSRRTAQWGLHCGNRCGSSRPTQRLASGSPVGKKLLRPVRDGAELARPPVHLETGRRLVADSPVDAASIRRSRRNLIPEDTKKAPRRGGQCGAHGRGSPKNRWRLYGGGMRFLSNQCLADGRGSGA